MITSPTTSRQAASPSASTPVPPRRENASPPPAASTPATAELQAALEQMALALQLSRASTMSLMRMQLAVRSGERMQAMEAMDRLDALDAELARVVRRLPNPGDTDPAWQTLAKHLDEQKLALAFEKLALASGIVGPDLVSIEKAWSADDEEAPQEPDDFPGAEMPDLSPLPPPAEELEAAPSRGLSPRALGLIVTLLIAAAIAAGVWFSMQP